MTQLVRPEPPAARDGHAWQPAPDPGWRLTTAVERSSRRCRYRGCEGLVVAAFNRRRRTMHGRVDSWWMYCPDHLYGRWIEDGRVMAWRAVRVES